MSRRSSGGGGMSRSTFPRSAIRLAGGWVFWDMGVLGGRVCYITIIQGVLDTMANGYGN